MVWFLVLEVVLRLLGPVLIEWLSRLLREAARELYDDAATPNVGLLFARARRKTWLWQVRRRAALRVAERMATARSAEIMRSAERGGFVPPLTDAEKAEFRAALV